MDLNQLLKVCSIVFNVHSNYDYCNIMSSIVMLFFSCVSFIIVKHDSLCKIEV